MYATLCDFLASSVAAQESYTTWDSLVGTTQQVWIVEFGKDENYIVGHTRGYAQVRL